MVFKYKSAQTKLFKFIHKLYSSTLYIIEWCKFKSKILVIYNNFKFDEIPL